MSQHGSSLRGGRLAQQILAAGQDAVSQTVSELRLRADSSVHGSTRGFERVFDVDVENPTHRNSEGSKRGGTAAAQASAAAPDTPTKAQPGPEPDPSTAWCSSRGEGNHNENTVWHWPPTEGIAKYFSKWVGRRGRADDIPTLETIILSTVASFLGILAISALNLITLPRDGLDEAVPSFGATAVLIYAVYDQSPLSQPRNFVGGQVLSAAVGCAFRVAFGPGMFWLSAPLAMSLALTLMQLTRTTHPPGGATAFVAATRPTMLPSHGFRFMGGILIGSLIMLIVALLALLMTLICLEQIDNLHHTKRYPKFWWGLRWPESWVP